MFASRHKSNEVAFTLSQDEALVLLEMLQRITQEDESKLLPLLTSSAEFAVLCRINNHLEKHLPEALREDYDDLLKRARARIVEYNGRYPGIEEQ